MNDLAITEPATLCAAQQPATNNRSRNAGSTIFRKEKLLWAGVTIVLAVRFVACLQDPATALDLERMLYWGLALNQNGMHAASAPLKAWGAPMGVAWRDIPA